MFAIIVNNRCIGTSCDKCVYYNDAKYCTMTNISPNNYYLKHRKNGVISYCKYTSMNYARDSFDQELIKATKWCSGRDCEDCSFDSVTGTTTRCSLIYMFCNMFNLKSE